ncbi:MAG TPA: hypothetical protein DEA96_19065 [Leptospiraceae bacterium]|nr:hypothetical protein [Spirochaetaceae bacterium]HBS07081.1 hypothetical protein [Leptospiraceae bacterium]|tara:strand:+ start:94248 stop:94589 length:342 start_codon:yes stop_codon:yes gene_type:complete
MKIAPVVMIGLLSLMSCRSFTLESQGPFLGSGNFEGFEVLSENSVEGEACDTAILLFFTTGEASPAAAFQEALKKSPVGTSGLSNVELESIERWFLLVHQKCVSISGTPARRI